MSILFKRAFSQTTSLVLAAILLLVAIVALIYAFDTKSLPTAWVSNVAQVTETQDKVIFNSSSSVICTDDSTKVSISAGSAENGGNALLVSTTKWAGAMIQFNNTCGGPVNFGGYDRVEFHIKGLTTTPDALTVYLHSYIAGADSAPSSVNPTASWSTVSVPISTLKGSGAWDLNNTQELRFRETPNGSSYYIDSIVLKAAGTPPPPTPVPVVTLSASPTSITAGQNSTLTWSSTNSPTSCTASGGWSGSKAASGSQTVTPTANTTYSLTCTNAGGTSGPASATVAITGTSNTYQPITVKGWTPPGSNQSLMPGSTITFNFNWIGGANVPIPKIGGQWVVFIHVLNAAGKDVWGAAFQPSPNAVDWTGNVSTPASFQIPSNTKAGTYSVLVGLYNGGERLPLVALDPARDMGASRYYVGSFSVITATNNLTPVISSIGLPYCIQNVYFCREDIKGANFTVTGNNVKLTSTTTGVVTTLGVNNTNFGNLPSGGDGTQLVADIPSNLAPGRYLLTDTVSVNGATKTSNGVVFDMLPISALPTITGVSPGAGPLGQAVTISGTHFGGNNAVQIGPFYYNSVFPNAAGNLVVNIPLSTTYTGYIGTPLKVSVDNDDYGYTGDNPSATQYTFTIQSGSPTDNTKPVISAIASTTGDTTATITWTTNEAADTQVLYGTTVGYGSNTTLDPVKVTSHSATISGLASNAIYHFSVYSKDAAGNLATSSDMTFLTKVVAGGDNQPPFPPYAVTATAVSSTQVNLTWGAATDNVGVSGYRIIRNGVGISTTTALAFSDTGLTAATTYSYVIKAFDAAGNLSASSTPSATATTQPTTPPGGTIDTTGGKLLWDGVINTDLLQCNVDNKLYNGCLIANGFNGPTFESTSGDYAYISVPSLSVSQKYDKLVFYIKANKSTDTAIKFSLRDGSNNFYSSNIPVLTYVNGGVVDTTYRQVVIPTSLITGAGATHLTFEKSSGTVIDVDSFYLVDTTPNTVKSVSALSNGTVKVLISDAYSTSTAPQLTDFTIRSADGTLPAINPIRIGRHFYPTDFAGGGLIPDPKSPVMDYIMYLTFDTAFVNDKDYIVTANHIRDLDGIDIPAPQSKTFTYRDYDGGAINGSVKANQVGYLPTAPKYAYVGNYLGDALGMPVPSGTECRIMKVGTGQVYATSTVFRANDPLMSGERVYSCDFSSYQPTDKSAQYYVYVPGVGRSYNFRIASDVYNNVFQTVLRGLYYQRSGTAIDATHGLAWARPAGHVTNDSTAIVHSTVRTQRDGVLHPLSDAQDVPGTKVNLLKGWFDAGDYGKYVGSGSVTISELLTAYDLFPGKFTDNQLNIPESGNTVPDILDEVRWELEWMKNMQSPNGGVYHKVATVNWTQSMPALDEGNPCIGTTDRDCNMYIAEKSTHATAQYAAVLAKAARIYAPYDATFASDLRTRAEKAWTFLEAHPTAISFGWNPPCTYTDDQGVVHLVNCNPPGIGGGENTDHDDAWDERAWAAAELYRLTGNATYKTAFLNYIRNNPLGDWMIYGAAASQRASFSYAFNPAVKASTDPADVNFMTSFKNGLKGYVADIVNRTLVNPYRNGSYIGDTEGGRKGNGWGAYSQATRYSWELIKAAELIKGDNPSLAAEYLKTAKIDFDAQLGDNPLNKTFITGIGSNAPKAPLHTISSLDGIAEPVPGIPIYGVHHDYTSYDAVNIGLRPNVWPADVTKGGTPYPTLRNYWDIRSIVETGEFTVIDFGYTAAAYAYFAE